MSDQPAIQSAPTSDVATKRVLAARPYSKHEQKEFDSLKDSKFAHTVAEVRGDLSHLRTVSGRPSLGRYLKQLIERRHFIWWDSKSRVSTANVEDRLGSFWLILRPLLDAAFYWLIFGLLLNMSRGLPNYIAFVIIGVFMFQSSSQAINAGTKVISSNKSMIRAFQFPRAALPLAVLVRDFLQRVPAMFVMIAIIMIIPPHELPSTSWLLFPVILLLQLCMDFGLLLVFSRLGVMLPDLSKAVPFATRLLMYGSGVIFPIDRFLNHPTLMQIINLNPIYVVLDMYRVILIDGAVPPTHHWVVLCSWAFGLLIFGFLFFWKGEESYSRERTY
ncbi:ABC transporter permease [Gulosibacter chungangensis]|uniref:Transport permease protein n=1 Tax=Gulosibacter chungangensis TaxID=979746 RepID=A0A7J5B7C8_9MICO|nr:ABC transporter permease [Gulosibacter chungangensis]KAB1640824.1 ABC transporter permease [Gulosibacter chungangensis]